MDDPVLVYDDDCGFCTWWAEFFADHSALRIVGFSELDPAVRERLPSDYETCSHVITESAVYSCGASFEEALLRADFGGRVRPPIEQLRRFDLYADAREWWYRRIAHKRGLWGKLLSSKTRNATETQPDDE